MNYVMFKKDGLYSKEYNENGYSNRWTRIKAPLYVYFQSVVDIDSRVTLGDIMHALIAHESDIDAMFMGCMNGKRLRPYYDEMIQAPTNKRTDLTHVEITWGADYFRADSINHDDELYLEIQVNGVSKDSEEANYHALSRAPLNDWKHLKVELNNTLIINEFIMEQQSDTGRTEMNINKILEAKKQITLYDLIAGIMSELTIYGYPEQRMERLEDMNDLIQDMEDETYMTTLQQKEKELREAIEVEHYEKAAKLKLEIDKLKKFSK